MAATKLPAGLSSRIGRAGDTDTPLRGIHESTGPVRFTINCKRLYWCPTTVIQKFLDIFIRRIRDNATTRGHSAQQLMKLPDNRFEIRVNISVIKFKIVQDSRARTVVNEFSAFIKKGGVVLVCLNHEIFRITKLCRDAEVRWNATNQKTRLEPCILQNPRQHTGSCRFAMRPGNGKHMAVTQHVFGKPLGS